MILNCLEFVSLLSTTIVQVETISNVEPSLSPVVVGALKVLIGLLIDSQLGSFLAHCGMRLGGQNGGSHNLIPLRGGLTGRGEEAPNWGGGITTYV